LDLQLASVYTSLSSREWRKRIEGLQLVRGLVTGGAGNMEEFPGRLKYLELPFEICVKDLRSQVIRESCVTIAYLAQELQFKIKSFLLHLLPFLIELIQHGAKVVSYSGVVCIRFILQHTFCPKFLPIICKSVSSKSRTTRSNVFQFLEQLLHVWPIHTLEGHAQIVQDVLMVGLGDSDHDTRSWARKAYWAFAVHFRVEADRFLRSLDHTRRQLLEGDGQDVSSEYAGISGDRSRQSSITRSQDSLDGSRTCSSESNFVRGGLRSSSRVTRGYGSLDHGRVSPLVSPIKRSNSAVDTAAARRVMVRQQYSQNSRNRVQRTGSMRRGSETVGSGEGNRKGTQSQPVSRSSSPSATRHYRTSVGPEASKEVIADQINPVRKEIFVKTETQRELSSEVKKVKSFPSYLTKDCKEQLNSATAMKEKNGIKRNKVNESDLNFRNKSHTGSNETSAVKQWVEKQNKYFGTVEATPYQEEMLDVIKTREEKAEEDKTSLTINNTKDIGHNLRALSDNLENAVMEDDGNKQLEILDDIKDLLEWISSDHLQSLLPILLKLMKSNLKEVSRNAETATINFLLTLPTNLSIPLLGNMVKKEQVMDMMIAIKLLDKLLEVQTAPDVSPHLKEIMIGLIKAYDNTESSVRKSAVNCMVTLHGLVGDAALQPHLYCLSQPKRKLLSLYIMRHRQKIRNSQL